MQSLEDFLATVPIFRDLSREQLREISPLLLEDTYPSGTVILHQGRHADAVHFLRSGQLAVRVQRPEGRETVAYLQPGAVFGELSFITGRSCSADVEVVVDADVVSLPKSAVPRLPAQRDAILRGMMTVLAERLHDTTTRGARVIENPVVLLESRPGWTAPLSFAVELGKSIARQTGRETLSVHIGGSGSPEPVEVAPHAWHAELPLPSAIEDVRSEVASRLTAWKQRFPVIVLNPVPAGNRRVCEQVEPFADFRGHLLGPGDASPEAEGRKEFVVQVAEGARLPYLSGNRQLLHDATASEELHRNGRPPAARFARVVDSIARFVADIQLGIALGGGAAWGWAHVGVLSVLEGAGVPIDVVAGCSMGSVIGTLRCSGRSVDDLKEIAAFWRTRTKRFIEWRVWRMHLLQEKMVRKAFAEYFGEGTVNGVEIPFWANAVDIKTGREFTIKDRSLIDAVRASIALPGLLPPFERESHLLVDAGILDPVPVNLVRRMGCRFAIAVNAMAPMEAQEVSRRYPMNMFDVMFRCTRIMGHEIGQARAESAANVMMTLPLGDISMLDFHRDVEIIDVGRKVAELNLPAILAGYNRLREFDNRPASSTQQARL